MFKKWFVCLAVLTVALLPCALAASDDALPGAQWPMYVDCGDRTVTDVVSDGNPDTVCYLALNSDTLKIYLNFFSSVDSVWIRPGDCSSLSAYQRHGIPAQVEVRIFLQTAYDGEYESFVFDLDTDYDMTTVSDDRYKGYQRLRLPKTYNTVFYIEVVVTQYSYYSTATDIAVSDVTFTSGASSTDSSFGNSPVPGVSLMRIATRSGPGTIYTEPGSFYQEGYPVDVISQAYDSANGIWWAQIEFSYQGKLMRAYTGVKRIDADWSLVPEETYLGSTTITRSVHPSYGPGTNYLQYDTTLRSGFTADVYASENGWVQLEYRSSASGPYRRAWVPADAVSGDW